MKNIVITGGAGFAGSNIAIALKEHFTDCDVIALDNLHRKGSELNVSRLEKHGVFFVNGDVRNSQDLERAGEFDFLIECSAEPSVLAGSDGDTDYLIKTNLNGAVNCADMCRKYDAPMIFLSTSRVYPIAPLLDCEISTTETRFELMDNQRVQGLSSRGVSEEFPMNGARSLYGGTKYAAEVMLAEYSNAFSFPVIINRCGVLAGPWQFGKADQGIATFWTAAHIFGKSLKYIGFEGSGKQVRDILHIDDLIRLLIMQIEEPEKFEVQANAVSGNHLSATGGVWNIGGGLANSVSLLELTSICREVTGNSIDIIPELEMRYADIPIYITDISKIENFCGWKPVKRVPDIIEDISRWIKEKREVSLARLFHENSKNRS